MSPPRAPRSSLIALGVAAACVAALLVWDARHSTTDESNRTRGRILPAFDRARAAELAIERPADATTVTLRHEAAGWWLTAPKRLRADDTAIESLLAVLEYGTVERRIADADAKLRTTTGVDAPRVIIRVEGHTLRIGADDPSRGVYVTRDAEPGILVAERRLIETAGIDPRLWLSMRLTLVDPAEAKQLATDAFTLERAAGWQVKKPVVTRAADAKVDALLQQLVRTRAFAVGSDVSADHAIDLSLDGATQARLGGTCAQHDPAGGEIGLLGARADGANLCFHKTDFDLLRAPPTTFYERRLFPLRLDDVAAIDIGPLSLRRESAAWRITAPLAAARPVKDEAVRAFLEPLLAAQARSFSATPVANGTRLRLATRDDEIVATVDDTRARRAGETVTLDLAAPLSLATSF